MDKREAHRMLAALRTGDAVTLTTDGRVLAVTVTREVRRMDGGGFGSWDHAAVTVGYGPGRWNTEVTAAGLEAGRYALRVGHVGKDGEPWSPPAVKPEPAPLLREPESFTDEARERYALSDCVWWDEPVMRRPWWARRDCSGRMTSTAAGVLCEEHYNAQPERA